MTSRFGLGAMVLGQWGNTDRAECIGMIRRALDAGVNLVDTADMYAQGENEEIVGEALRGRRDSVILTTKFHHQMGDDPACSGNSRRWITSAVEDSLRRLGTDYIDVYQAHRPDPGVPIEETVEALTDLVTAGKIRHWGTSTFPAEDIVAAHWGADRANAIAPATEQPPYSILCRGIERDVLTGVPPLRHRGAGLEPPVRRVAHRKASAGRAGTGGKSSGDQPRSLRRRQFREVRSRGPTRQPVR